MKSGGAKIIEVWNMELRGCSHSLVQSGVYFEAFYDQYFRKYSKYFIINGYQKEMVLNKRVSVMESGGGGGGGG